MSCHSVGQEVIYDRSDTRSYTTKFLGNSIGNTVIDSQNAYCWFTTFTAAKTFVYGRERDSSHLATWSKLTFVTEFVSL